MAVVRRSHHNEQRNSYAQEQTEKGTYKTLELETVDHLKQKDVFGLKVSTINGPENGPLLSMGLYRKKKGEPDD